MMNEEAIRQSRFRRVRATARAGLPALTVLRARQYLDEFPGDDALNDFVWYWLGKALADLSRHVEAEEALANALRLCPEGKSRACGITPDPPADQLDGLCGSFSRGRFILRASQAARKAPPKIARNWTRITTTRDLKSRTSHNVPGAGAGGRGGVLEMGSSGAGCGVGELLIASVSRFSPFDTTAIGRASAAVDGATGVEIVVRSGCGRPNSARNWAITAFCMLPMSR
jgi:hypothetical protein